MINESQLAIDISEFESVHAAYPAELARCEDALLKQLPVLVECDKELIPYFYQSIRERLRPTGLRCEYLDGRNCETDNNGITLSLLSTMINELRQAVRGSVEQALIVLPHLDLLAVSSSGLNLESREVIALMYENPNIVWLAFKDHSMQIPLVLDKLFPHRECIIGIARERLPYLVTQRESRKFGSKFNLYQMYKYVSGMNSVRLRRLLASVQGEDYPECPSHAYRQLRSATLSNPFSIPDVDLEQGIGGYKKIKTRLRKEILDIIALKDKMTDAAKIKNLELLIPKGMIFWGPPGTGKTLFAKAIASALGAVVIVVSGPELKSRWVGESEAQIRQIFIQARNSAPAVIIFDELDSFATARGTYSGAGVEHSMINQLLTEMDGFRENEMVFVIGTTNFSEALDPALLRPGRFEFQLHIPYPDSNDRHEIFKIYERQFNLNFSQSALDYLVKRTSEQVEASCFKYSGDHIQALCRTIARIRLRQNKVDKTTINDVEEALTQYLDRPVLSAQEEGVIATHECGHAICALHCEHLPAIDRISILGDLTGTLGFISYGEGVNKYIITQGYLLDCICVLFGGREAEVLLLNDVSIGAAHDIAMATDIARSLVEEYGLGPEQLQLRFYIDKAEHGFRREVLSENTQAQLDAAINQVLEQQRLRANAIVTANKDSLLALRKILIQNKVIDQGLLAQVMVNKSNGY